MLWRKELMTRIKEGEYSMKTLKLKLAVVRTTAER
jgi:hypothetical protein